MKSRTIAWVLGSTVGALLLIEAVRAFGQVAIHDTVRVEWDANSEPDLAGYRVRAGTNSGQPLWSRDVGMVTTAVIAVSNHPQLFVTVTAYNEIGLESDPSNELRISGKPGQVQGVRGAIAIDTTVTVTVTNTIWFP